MLVALLAFALARVALGHLGVEALLLLRREQGADALAPLLADGVVARAALGAQGAKLVARLVEHGLDLAGLLVRQAEVGAHPLEDVLPAVAALARVVAPGGAQAVSA